MEKKVRITKSDARRIIKKWLFTFSSLCEKEDEGFYQGIPKSYLPENIQHLAIKERFGLENYYPTKEEIKIFQFEAEKLSRFLLRD